MVYMLEKKYSNDELEIEPTSYIDNKQKVWFKGKDVVKILGYSDTKQAIKKHVDNEDKLLHFLSVEGVETFLQPPPPKLGGSYRPLNEGPTWGRETRPQGRWYTSPGSLSNLITMWPPNMVSLSEILSDLIRCKLVRYPWFCSARPRSFTCFKMADVYQVYWSKFPS